MYAYQPLLALSNDELTKTERHVSKGVPPSAEIEID